MGKPKELLILFLIVFLLVGPIFVDATWNVFSTVGDPQCINGDSVEVTLIYNPLDPPYQDQNAIVNTNNIHIFVMWNGATGNTYITGEWGAEQWGPKGVVSLKLGVENLYANATHFGMEWLNPATPGDGLSGNFVNPCYTESVVSNNGCTGSKTCYRVSSVNIGTCDFSTYPCTYSTYQTILDTNCAQGAGSFKYGSEPECLATISTCGNKVCAPSENCDNCPQDCGCKASEICSEDNYYNWGYNCMPIIDIKELDSSKEIDLNIIPGQDNRPSVIIKKGDKNQTLIFGFTAIAGDENFNQEEYLKNNPQPINLIYAPDKYLAIYSGEIKTIKLDSIGEEINIKLIDMDYFKSMKLLFSKPSKFNFNKQYLYYGIIAVFVVIILFSGFFYLFKDILLKRKKNSDSGFSKGRTKEIILEKETKEKIPSNITEAITINGLGVKKGSNTILENVSFTVKRGEFVSLLGPSGSGKSTIIEILAGRRKPSLGKVNIFGKNLDEEGINKYIGFVPQGNELYLNQTVHKNLENSAIKWGIKNSEQKISYILEQVNLMERKNLIANKLSGGQQKLLSLAMELIREPELLILDEPTTGLDPNTRNQIITLLCNLSRYDKKTVLITTHFMDDSEECDEVVIINDKKIVARGSPDKLKKMLPGSGKMVTLVLDNSDRNLLDKIRKIKGVERLIAEGRTLNILTNNPNAVEIANKVHEYGGYVNESKISRASMKEVFVFFTGRSPEE